MLKDRNTCTKVKVLDDGRDIKTIEKSKLYIKPKLKKMGDLRSLTLGTSTFGGKESGPAGEVYNYV